MEGAVAHRHRVCPVRDGGALRQLVVLVPCLWLLIRFFGVDYAWFAFWASEILACVYSLWAARKELKNKVEQQ